MAVELSNKDVMGIIRRRKGIFLTSFFIIFLTCLGIALYLPSVYRAESTIVIENQDIPEDFVRSTITTYINERLYMLQQQILSREEVLKLVNKYNLYETMDSTTEKVLRMREDIKLQTIDTAVLDERTGRAKTVTVAFKLSYEGQDPQMVVQVAGELANFFVEQDIRSKAELSGTTTNFFEKELGNLKKEISAYEAEISRFKAKNIDMLPGSIGVKQQKIAYLNQELERINTRIRTLREKNIYLEAQILNVNPLSPVVSEEGKLTKNPVDRLKYLRLQLIRMRASLSPKHPDIKALKREIAELEGQGGDTNTSAEKIKLLKQMRDDLANKKNKLGDSHPDVIRITKEVELLAKDVDRMETGSAMITRLADEKPDNPAYMNLKAQIVAADAEIKSLEEERRRKEQELEENRNKVEMIPLVEEEYNALTLNYESAKQKYNDIRNKLFAANISRQMDVNESGERFEIVEPAYLPEKPYKPNRVAIILFGLVLGLFTALSLAALQEGRDRSIKSSDEIEAIVGVPVIATVSFFESDQQKRKRRFKTLAGASAIILILVCGSVIAALFLIP
jgi:succinoglycan biosynthesis transport protein ExoP